MQHLEGSGTPVLYIGRTVLKGLLGCPDVLSLVSGPLSGNGCVSPKHIAFLLFLFFTCCFIYSLYS